MNLYIAEKASVARALSDVLPGQKTKGDNCIRCGDDTVVAWASGHLLALCEPEDYDERYKKWTNDTLLYVPEKWKRNVIPRTKPLLDGIKKLLKEANTVINVGDADREGQLLIDEILDYCGWKGKTERLRFSDLNPGAIRKALENTKDNSEFHGEYLAGQARMYADWLVGLAVTRYVTVSLRNAGYKAEVMSVGRVQTPTLALVVRREKEIREFTPSPYYELSAVLTLDGGREVKGRWLPKDAYLENISGQKRITDKENIFSLAKKLDGAAGSVISVTNKAHKVSPPLLFSLSKLQMAASKKHDITDTLVHAQKLYESGYITYPRAGCEYIPESHFSEAGKIIEAIRAGCPSLADISRGVDLSRKSPAWNDKKIVEHHAIIPTARVPRDGSLPVMEQRIYELICSRYILQFLADYEYEETVVEFEAKSPDAQEMFRTSGRTVTNMGWQGWDKDAPQSKQQSQQAHGNGDDDEGDEMDSSRKTLPVLHQGEPGVVHASVDEKKSQPPKPFTYHSLLAAMNGIHAYVKDPAIREKLRELQGIGTEATQENVLTLLFRRGYLEKKKKIIQPTALGQTLIGLLNAGEKTSVLVNPDMTALWEQTVTDIENGKTSLETFISEVAGMVRGIISEPLDIPDDIPGLERKKTSPAEHLESGCPMEGCGGKAARFERKKDSSLFWKCAKCGSFFDDADGKPVLREKKEKKFSGSKKEAVS